MDPDRPKRGWWSGWRKTDEEETIGERLIEVQIERLQREVRLFRALFVLVVLAFAGIGAAWMMQAQDPAKDVIRAHKIEVLSENGREVVVLDSDRIGGRIALRFDQALDPPPPAMFLSAAPEGGALQLFEPGQNFYALGLNVGRDGEGVVKVRTRGRQEGVELRGPTSDAKGGEVVIYNGDGHAAVRLATDNTGHGVVAQNDVKR